MSHQQPAGPWYGPPEPPGPAPGIWFAPHGERLVAYILDALILSLIAMVSVMLLALIVLGGGETAPIASLLWLVGLMIVTIGYFPFFWARGGQTPGMGPFRLYVVRDGDGGPVGAGRALLRLLGFWVNGLVLYIGFIWVFVDARRRGWHDLIAGTLVVKR